MGREIIASRVGVSRTTLYNWRDGTTRPGRDEVARLSESLSIPFEELWLPDQPIQTVQLERLATLESAVRRMRAILEEINGGEARVEGPPLPVEDDFPSTAPYEEPFREEPARERQRPRKRRGKSA